MVAHGKMHALRPVAVAAGRLMFATLMLLHLAVVSRAEPVEVALEQSGLTLVANYTKLDGKSGDDPVVLMVHGTFAHKDMELMVALQTALEERDIQSLAITLSLGVDRRRGQRDCALPITDTYADSRAELTAWVNWLKEKGHNRIVLLGHSRGGARVADYLTVEKVDPVIKAAVLLAPATEAPGRFAREYRGSFSDAQISSFQETLDASAPDKMFDLPGFLYCPKARASAAAIQSYYGANQQRDTPTILKSVNQTKVLVVAAGADSVAKDLPDKMSAFTKSDTVTFRSVPDADHMFLDFFAEDAADRVAEFVGAAS